MSLADEVYKELLKRLSIKTALVIGKEKTEFENGFFTVEAVENAEYDSVIIRNLENSMLVNLALGRAGNLNERLVLKAFYEGKKVYISKSGIAYRKMYPKVRRRLFKLYEEYEKQILDYGAELIGWESVITEKDVSRYSDAGGKCITVSQSTIVTPLAMDFIKAHNMKLERR